jgi:hypothetical protein
MRRERFFVNIFNSLRITQISKNTKPRRENKFLNKIIVYSNMNFIKLICIKTRVRFAARLLQAGVPVNDECT